MGRLIGRIIGLIQVKDTEEENTGVVWVAMGINGDIIEDN